MKKFTFGLEKILRLRSWAEENARNELGRAVSEKAELERSIMETAEKRVNAMAARFDSGSAARLQLYEAYLSRLDNEKEELLIKAAEAELKIEAARETWREAAAALKTMNNLKDRRLAAHRKASLAAEEKEIDDMINAPRTLINERIPAKEGPGTGVRGPVPCK